MKTALCDLLGIEYPIIQGAMAHITDGKFAGIVSEAGALGVIQCGFNPPEYIREEIQIARSITDKPFAVNLIMENDRIEEIARVVVEEKVAAATISAGNPAKIVPILVEGGVKCLCLIPHARAAKKMQDLGATAVIAEGMESGGHVGRMTTLPMVRQVLDAVDIPVIAAGGIGDGKGMLAALAMGCVGVQMGTAFLATDECPIDQKYKDMVIAAKDNSTVLTGIPGGKEVRCIKNEFSDKFWEMYNAGTSEEELIEYCTGSITKAVYGDVVGGAVSAGQIAGLISEIKPVAQLVQDVCAQCDEAYAELKRIYG